MIVKWTTVKPVIARIVRNVRNIDSDYMADLPEWIAEGIFKLKTHYQLELRQSTVTIKFHKGMLPCEMEALSAVTYNGMRILPGDTTGPLEGVQNTTEGFYSVLKAPSSITELDETDINNLPFYLATVEQLSIAGINYGIKYRLNYNKLETNMEAGELQVWYWSVPVDEDNFPMVPDHEDYQTALYWYCRMMMIGAGHQDLVFNYDKCEYNWEKYAARAIHSVSYPSPDEKQRNIINNVSLIPHQYDWETFGGGGQEQPFID